MIEDIYTQTENTGQEVEDKYLYCDDKNKSSTISSINNQDFSDNLVKLHYHKKNSRYGKYIVLNKTY